MNAAGHSIKSEEWLDIRKIVKYIKMPLSKRKKQEDFLMECSNAKTPIAVKSMTEVMDLEGFVQKIVNARGAEKSHIQHR